MANLFKDFDAKPFMKRKPPSDNSFDTDQELKQLSKIPINKKTRSLNVAMSVAIVTSEALKQNNLI